MGIGLAALYLLDFSPLIFTFHLLEMKLRHSYHQIKA